MKSAKAKAFMMVDSLVSLLVVAMGINLFFICEKQLWLQDRNLQLKMAATRLGKEASDLYALRLLLRIQIHQNQVARRINVAALLPD